MSLPLKQRVLIAEDEPGIADTLQYVLRSDGFEPVWCATAQEALAQFQAQPPALAILDIGLPDMNGFELFKRLQSVNRASGGPDVPIIFLTARNDEIDRVVGLELGADDYIAKPFSPRELVARVRTILRRSGQRQRQRQRQQPDRRYGGHRGTTCRARRTCRPRDYTLRAGRRAHADPLLRPPAGALAL